MSDKRWYALEMTVAAQAADAIEHALNELGALGTEIDQLRKKQDNDITVVGYFDQQPDEVNIRNQVDLALDAFGFPSAWVGVRSTIVENKDWLSEWKKYWKPTRIGRFLIAPTWEDTSGVTDQIVIRIEPNMAFGTGTHETTRFCLKAIDANYEPEMSFLDVGTGTGILAIAAAKSRSDDSQPLITAIDIDEDSIAIARRNALDNRVNGQIDFLVGTLEERCAAHDFVCANLTLDVILPQLELLLAISSKRLVLSGILTEQEGAILSALENLGIFNSVVEHDGEWISVMVRR